MENRVPTLRPFPRVLAILSLVVTVGLAANACAPVRPPPDLRPVITDFQLPEDLMVNEEVAVTARVAAGGTDNLSRVTLTIRSDTVEYGWPLEPRDDLYRATAFFPAAGKWEAAITATDNAGHFRVLSVTRTALPPESDLDQDGLTLAEERRYRTGPNQPNPAVSYAARRGLEPRYFDLVRPLETGGVLEERDRAGIDAAVMVCSMRELTRATEEKNVRLVLTERTGPEWLAFNESLPERETLLDFLRFGVDRPVLEYAAFCATLPDRTFARWALAHRLCLEDRVLTDLERDFLREPSRAAPVMQAYLAAAGNTNALLSAELRKLPAMAKPGTREIEALEDIVAGAAGTEAGGVSIAALLGEGDPAKRAYCAPLEALAWLYLDFEPEALTPALARTGYSAVPEWANRGLYRLVRFAWENGARTGSVPREAWMSADNVTARLSTFLLAAAWPANYQAHTGDTLSAASTLASGAGDCDDLAGVRLLALRRNGFTDKLESGREGGASNIDIWFKEKDRIPGTNSFYGGHTVTAYRTGGSLYYTENAGGIKGPYADVETLVAGWLKEARKTLDRWEYAREPR